ncbi:phosphoglycolate phosphatase [Saccharobesus litoralis]|uniref:Phosphoglycolate phosphatase n=1 Tax=Saccharobesus litoralis TaxID=2172099 RepID=A0A2S0VXT4_9ALTE|nr:phosphoglycolate phosphatase [Saccharobesus litoralis]
MITKPQAVLFDLDGTLLDTARDLGNALNAVLRELNYPEKSYDEYRDSASHGSYGMLRIGLGEDYDKLISTELRQKFLDYYESAINQATIAFDGVKQTLLALDEQNIPWGIVTNKPGYLTDQLAIQFPLFKNCQAIVSGDTLPERKPHPAPLLLAAEQMQVDPSQCWYIGDALRDIEAGNNANMLTFVAEWGYTKDTLPTNCWQADYHLDSPFELAKTIKNLR